MSSGNDDALLPDLEWDAAYLASVIELGERNALRYEKQAEQIIREKSFSLELNNFSVKYALNRTGCWFEASDSKRGIQLKSWNRFGWGKSSKRRALPRFFAKTETDILFSNFS